MSNENIPPRNEILNDNHLETTIAGNFLASAIEKYIVIEKEYQESIENDNELWHDMKPVNVSCEEKKYLLHLIILQDTILSIIEWMWKGTMMNQQSP